MERFIGIDLGTTYSSIATIDEYGQPVIVKTTDGESLIPSAVYVDSSGNEIVGVEAKEMMQAGVEDVAVFFKRYMGNKDMVFHYAGKPYTPTDLSTVLLRKIKMEAEASLGSPVTKAVITVPAYFNDIQRNETMKAGRDAGFQVLRIINEPTAAAIMYGFKFHPGQRVLVYDLGGGTFDVTVLEMTLKSINVLSTGGDHELGGKDWDDQLVNYVGEQFRLEYGFDLSDSIEAYNDLAFNCEKLKKQLSAKESSSITVRYEGVRGKYSVSRALFEQLTEHLLRSTKSMAELVLNEAGLQWKDIDGVLLVGGSTRMPMVENWVREMSGKEPLRGVNVDEAVALGAAIQAGIEVSRQLYSLGGMNKQQYQLASSIDIVDVMSHSLGTIAISEDGLRYINSRIISKNKPVPITERKEFLHHTNPNGDNTLDVYLTQGESSDIKNCIVVGKYVLSGIKHQPNGTKIEICYSYDLNGMVVVEGIQQETGISLHVDKVDLDENLDWLYEKPRGKHKPLSIIIAIDLSGSMIGSPVAKARDAAREFVMQLSAGNPNLENIEIGLMGFADKAEMVCRNSNNVNELLKTIKKIDAGWTKSYPNVGGGNDNNPLEDAYRKFNDVFNNKSDKKKILVVLTDGVWSNSQRAIKWSDRYREESMDIIAVGFGGADEKFLRRISTSSENALLTDLDHLVESFSNIAQEISRSGGTKHLSWKR